MLLTSESDWKEELLKIKGVKKISLASRFPGEAIVNVRYNFWTYLWFGLNKRISKRVHDLIYRQKPYNVKFNITSKKDKQDEKD